MRFFFFLKSYWFSHSVQSESGPLLTPCPFFFQKEFIYNGILFASFLFHFSLLGPNKFCFKGICLSLCSIFGVGNIHVRWWPPFVFEVEVLHPGAAFDSPAVEVVVLIRKQIDKRNKMFYINFDCLFYWYRVWWWCGVVNCSVVVLAFGIKENGNKIQLALIVWTCFVTSMI